MQNLLNKKIILGVCGSVAAYKSAYLIRILRAAGASVRVVMTESAKQFVSPLLMQALTQNEVHDLFDPNAEAAMGHIELARWSDYLLISPVTANFLSKMAQGIADDLLSTLYLVCESPIIVCPAMNKSMWAHPATQSNCQLLAARGVAFVGPQDGLQACGEEGLGRLSETEAIIAAVHLHAVRNLLRDKYVIITAGPTREAIDPVRYISNYSSGKMGYALAQAAAIAGAKVILISGPSALQVPQGINFIRVESAESMLDRVMQNLHAGSIFIGAAAVADYRLERAWGEKIKKAEQNELKLSLIKNPDILQAVVASGKAAYVVGFAAETNNLINYARKKLQDKGLDMIIANPVGQDLGFEQDYSEACVLTKSKQLTLPFTHKIALAGKIIAILAANMQNARVC